LFASCAIASRNLLINRKNKQIRKEERIKKPILKEN
jgi:hypothetical protein